MAVRSRPAGRRGWPVRLTGFGWTALLGLAVTGQVARDGNPALVGSVTAVLGALAIVGAVVPVTTVARARPTVSGPRDAVAGGPVTYRVEVPRPGVGVEVRVGDPPGGRVAVVGPGRSTAVVEGRAPARGVYVGVTVEVSSSGPLGLVSRCRTDVVSLAEPLAVAPRPAAGRVGLAALAPLARADAPSAVGPGPGDVVRSVRPYVVGDPAHLVHWPTTARVGSPVVREVDPPSAPRVAVVVDLGAGGADAEEVASVAAAIVGSALATGFEVVLSTAEPTGPVTGRVGSVRDAGRRLAQASPGHPAPPPPGWPSVDARAVWRQAGTQPR